MIEKTVAGEILDSGKKYNGSYEQGVFFHVKDEKNGKTYIVCFSCDNADDAFGFSKGKYMIFKGHLRYSNSKYDELDVQQISVPFVEFFDEIRN